MNKYLVKRYGLDAQLDICVEECSELIRACIHVKRACGKGYATNTSILESAKKLEEEIAHVTNAIRSIKYLLEIPDERIEARIKESDERAEMLGRLKNRTEEEE